MTTLYRHRIYCTTENAWVEKWTENQTLLTTCPTNTGHDVQAGSASINGEQASGKVEIDKEPTFATGGHIGLDTVVLAAPASDSVTIQKTWDFDVSVFCIKLAVLAENVGNFLTADIAPLVAAGQLTADAPIGTTVLDVDAAVIAMAYPGYIVTLQEGGTVQEVGCITAIDSGAGTITVKDATTSDFFLAGPTNVKIGARPCEALELAIPGYLVIGDDRYDSSPFPKGKMLEATLTNPGGSPSRLVAYISYAY